MARIKDHIFPLALLAPLIGLIGLSFGYMLLRSFLDQRMFRLGGWVGLSNYCEVLSSTHFWSSMRFGLTWALETVVLQTVVGLALAILLNETFRGRGAARALIFLPYLLMVPVTTILFLILFSSTFGVVSVYLRELGSNIFWYDKTHAPILLTIAAGWQYAPFSMLILLAGLQSIPADLYEAAKIDGAGSWGRFVHVTLPGIRDAIFVAVVLRVILMFNKFDLPWLMTAGGPMRATENVAVYAYKEAFESFNLGTASAAGTIMLITVGILVFVHFKVYARIAGSHEL